ncbi:MAG: hypothetical protein AUK44_10775 [Porphyromonadaceae bacterium CG2_30_38_12]|nr:MAG: hypothetical protein AUK44_10775 [Porphyromonadaceae bacterium CG2_30_38_12]
MSHKASWRFLRIVKMRTITILLFFGAFLLSALKAEGDTIRYQLLWNSMTATTGNSPFWFQNNRYGTVPFDATNTNLFATIRKDKSANDKLFDYNFVASGYVGISNKQSALYLHELYLNARLWVFNASVGMREEFQGTQDETLSSGGLLFSQNARPMPKVFIGIEDFTPLFFKNKMLEVKGGMYNGWFTDQVYTQNLLFHHKFAYLRVGGIHSPIHLQYGLEHAAQWGGIVPGEYGQQPIGFTDFINVFRARGGSSAATLFEQINVGGNHIMSQSAKVELKLSKYDIKAYWQNISEDQPVDFLWNSVNVADGLWGITVQNKAFPFIQKVLYEYLNTTDQSGPFHDMDGVVYGGNDSYFNNYLYQNGWTHYGRTIGTPFITSPIYNKNKEIGILNNRVQVHHIGVEGYYHEYNYRILSSFTKNYGTYSDYPNETLRTSTNMLLEVNKHFEKIWNVDIGIQVGLDAGSMYGNNTGFALKISKKGILFHIK